MSATNRMSTERTVGGFNPPGALSARRVSRELNPDFSSFRQREVHTAAAPDLCESAAKGFVLFGFSTFLGLLFFAVYALNWIVDFSDIIGR